MIPVQMEPEPKEFDEMVRKKGQQFLLKLPNPQEKDWKNKEYWRKAIPSLRRAHNNVCAYCAQWIPTLTGTPTVDHYVPKSVEPDLAYEWSNFRLSCLQMNTNKGNFRDVLDPFLLLDNWFQLDFGTYLIKPNPDLGLPEQQKIRDTIIRLKLNSDESCVTSRREWIDGFLTQGLPFPHIQERAPFIAYELKRQGFAPS